MIKSSTFSALDTRHTILITALKKEIKPSVPIVDTPKEVAKTTSTTQVTKTTTEKDKPVKVVKVTIPTPSTTEVSRGSNDVSTVISTAMNLQGSPYAFGGTTPKGFDCSGFTQYVFKKTGINLPRTSFEQFNYGEVVNNSQLQAGDLVFFTTYEAGASHVGLYVGGGQFIHAANQKSGVITTDIKDSWYSSRYVGARRPF